MQKKPCLFKSHGLEATSFAERTLRGCSQQIEVQQGYSTTEVCDRRTCMDEEICVTRQQSGRPESSVIGIQASKVADQRCPWQGQPDYSSLDSL